MEEQFYGQFNTDKFIKEYNSKINILFINDQVAVQKISN